MRGRDIDILEIGNTRSKAVFISNDEVREFYTDQGERTISSAVTITDAKADVGNKYLEERYPDHVVRRAFRLLNRFENSSEAQEEMRIPLFPSVSTIRVTSFTIWRDFGKTTGLSTKL